MVEPMPPMPLVTATPSRHGSTVGDPASAQASRAATSANCSHLSSRLACTRPTSAAGSAAAGAAIFTGSGFTQSSVMRRTPLLPASIADQVDATSPPSGVVAPSPVTTTLTRSLLLTATSANTYGTYRDLPTPWSGVLAHVVDDVLDGLQVLELLVRDLDAELVLGRHGDLHHRQRVDVEVVDEVLLGRHFVGGHAGDLVDDLGEPGQNLLVSHCFSFCVGAFAPPCGPHLITARLGYRDHLRGVRQPGTEPEQQRGGAWLQAALLGHPGQRERDRRRRGVPRVHDVIGDPVARDAQPAGDCLDDTKVRLVRDERRDVSGCHPGPSARLERHRVQRRRRPPEHRLPVLPDGAGPAGNRDLVRLVPGAAPDDRPDPGRLIIGARTDHGRPGAVGEDDARRPVGPVDPRGHLLRADHQHVPRAARPHRVGRRGERVAEPGARRVEVVGSRRDEPEPVGDGGGHVGQRHLGAACRDDHQVDGRGGQPARRERLGAGRLGHVRDGLVVRGDPPALDPDARPDPLVTGVDDLRQVVVGDHLVRLIPAERENPRPVHACSSGSSRTSGWPSPTGSPSSTSHSVSTASCEAVTGRSPPRWTTWPRTAPARTVAPAATAPASPSLPPERKVPPPGATTIRHSAGTPTGTAAYPFVDAACAAMSSRAASSWSGDFSASSSTPGRARLASPVSVPPGASSISAVTPMSDMVSMHRSQRTGAATWATIRSPQY